MAKTKKAKAKAEPKPDVKNTHIFDLARPMKDGESCIALAKAWADGRMNNPNVGRMTPSQYGDCYRNHWHIDKNGEPLKTDQPKIPPTIPAMYQPLVMDYARDTNGRCVVTCQAREGARKPAAWEDSFGDWDNKLRISEPGEVRPCHKRDARKMVVDSKFLVVLRIGKHDVSFVIGDDESAIYSINGSKSGSYGANLTAGKRASLGDAKGLNNLVGRFNPDYRIDLLDDGTDPGAEIAWGPNMVCDWGYLTRDDKNMSYAQIRSMAEKFAGGDKDACKDVKFEQLEDPIVGEAITQSQLWTGVKAVLSRASTKDDAGNTALERFSKRDAEAETPDRAWYNLSVQCRTSPHEIKPNGFFSVQTGIVPVACFGDSLDDPRVRFVIAGRKVGRLGLQFGESRSDARLRLGLVGKPAEKKTKTAKAPAEKKTKTAKAPVEKKPKAKTTKKKAVVKKAPVKKAKRVVKKVQADDAAAPVTVDTESTKGEPVAAE